MKIVIFSWRGPGHPLAGGAELSTHELAKRWVKFGHRVTLFTAQVKGKSKSQVIDGVTIIRQGNDVFGVQVMACIWYLFGRHEIFDVVIDQFHGIPFFTPLYVRKAKLGYIHEVAQKVWALNTWPQPFNLIPAWIGKLGEPLVFKIFYKNCQFMTVSRSTRQDLVEFGISKISVVHNGVTLPKKLPKKTKNKVFTFTYISALTADKGIEDVLMAFKLFCSKYAKCQLWIAGKSEATYLKKLINLWQDLPIKYFGYVSEQKKFLLLSRADALINASVHEGWGLINIEANAVGTPVVGYRVSGTQDSIKNNASGLLVSPVNPEFLSRAMTRLFLHPSFTRKLSVQSKAWAKKFTWEAAAEKSLALLNRIKLT